MNKTKVLIVEDHPLVREMLSELVQSQPEMALVGEVASAEAGLALLDAIAPELALVNLSLPGMDGPQLVATLLERRPNLKCIMVTSHAEDIYVNAALRAGAKGYVQKGDTDALLDTIRRVLQGETVVRLEETV
ncbi:hypothetical protein BH24DEI2_BH24DEI2_10020 [soil metagenome]